MDSGQQKPTLEMSGRHGEFGVYLAQLRHTVGVSQEEFAKLLGCSRSYIAALESGERKPNLQLLCALRNRYRVSIDALTDALRFDLKN